MYGMGLVYRLILATSLITGCGAEVPLPPQKKPSDENLRHVTSTRIGCDADSIVIWGLRLTENSAHWTATCGIERAYSCQGAMPTNLKQNEQVTLRDGASCTED